MIAILRAYTVHFMLRFPWARQVQCVLSRILLCRTAPLGGRVYECPQCQTKTHLYNSCVDRHCPQCAGAKRADWLDKAAKLILPNINYFQVIFTLPDYLDGLTLGNRQEIYELLLQSAWQALDTTLRDTGKFQPAALMVLHTWNQQLDHHAHVHALVPGGGPSLDGQRWLTSKHPTQVRRTQPYLADNLVLGTVFREKFIIGLRRLVKANELRLDGTWSVLRESAGLEDFIQDLKSVAWNVFVEGPPNGQSNPAHVLKYLARYLTGGPIADSRLIAVKDDKVTFWARPKANRPGQAKSVRKPPEPFTISCLEFVRRWAMHILPKRFTRTRRFGGFSGGQCTQYIELCKKLLNIQPAEAAPPASDVPAEPQPKMCAKCKIELKLISDTTRPSWRVVFERLYADGKIYTPMRHSLHEFYHKFVYGAARSHPPPLPAAS